MDNKKDIIRYLLRFIRICPFIIINSRPKSKKHIWQELQGVQFGKVYPEDSINISGLVNYSIRTAQR